MKKTIVITIFFLFIFLSTSVAQTLEDVKWYTEEYPPYNYVENGVTKGISVDLLLAVWKKAGLNKTLMDIQVVPWARGVRIIKSIPGTCLFSTTLTAERKEILGWKYVYPIPRVTEDSINHIVAKKSKKIKFNSIDDIKKYSGNFGVIRDDIGASLLVEAGVNADKLDKTVTPESLIMKLHKGRHDVISYGFPTTVAILKKMGIDPTYYEIVYSFPMRPTGYAFHHNTDPAIIKKLQKALDDLYLDGTAEKILHKYTNH